MLGALDLRRAFLADLPGLDQLGAGGPLQEAQLGRHQLLLLLRVNCRTRFLHHRLLVHGVRACHLLLDLLVDQVVADIALSSRSVQVVLLLLQVRQGLEQFTPIVIAQEFRRVVDVDAIRTTLQNAARQLVEQVRVIDFDCFT